MKRKFLLAIGLSLIFLCLIQIYVLHILKPPDKLEVDFFNVGQGDAIFIQAPNGVQVLIDAGPDLSVLQELAKVMNPFDRSIDLLIATHPDLDHVGGFPEVLGRFEAGVFVTASSTKVTAVTEEIEKLIPVLLVNAGDRILLDSVRDIYIDILFPYDEYTTSDANDRSVVTRVVYGEIDFVLTGDASQKVEKYLLENYPKYLEAEVLKAGHHGSKTSSAEEFIKTVSPSYVVISAGEGNKYGHPSDETLETLEKFDLEILETKNGAVHFETDGKVLEIK